MKIDHREAASLREYVDDTNESIEWSQLLLGDFIISGLDDSVYSVFERKTLADLAASIKDGRYKLQKEALLEAYGKDNVFYIIEGDVSYSGGNKHIGGIKNDAIIGAILNTILRDGISVFYTKNAKETVALMTNILDRYQKNPEKYIKSCSEEATKTSCTSIAKRTHPDNCYLGQLCQIPGVSQKTAESIQEKYPNMVSLVTSLVANPDALNGLKTTDGNGKSRCVSRNTIERIVDYLGVAKI